MADQIRENDVGTQFIFTIYDNSTPVDLSVASGVSIVFKKPDYSTLTVVPSFVTDGSDGQVRYISTAGVLTPHGFWNVQAIVVDGTGTYSSTTHQFTVSQNL